MKSVSVLVTIVCVMLGLVACGGGSGDSAQPVTQSNALPVVSVTQTGSTSYSIDAAKLNSINGFDLTLNYDTASLTSPSVTLGSLVAGAIMFSNSNIPGTFRIAIISSKAISGSGQIATISFGSQTGSGGIVSGTASLVDSTGKSTSAVMSILPSSTGTTVAPAAPFTPVPAEPVAPVQPPASNP